MLLSLAPTLFLVVVALLNLSDWILKERPLFRLGYDMIKPFESYVGLAAISQGLYALLAFLIHVRSVLNAPLMYVSGLLGAGILLLLGFLLAYPMIDAYLAKSGGSNASQTIGKMYEKAKDQQSFLAQMGLLVAVLHLTIRLLPAQSFLLHLIKSLCW